PGVHVSAYRTVQEARTNVARHAPPATAELSIRYRPDEVEIELTDDGRARRPAVGGDDTGEGGAHRPEAGGGATGDPGARRPEAGGGATGDGGGHGLVGMRERVALY